MSKVAPPRAPGPAAAPPERPAGRGRSWPWAASVVLLALLAYANALPHPFVWDDLDLVQHNPSLTPAHLPELLTEDFGKMANPPSPSGLYRPVVLVSFLVDRLVHGGGAFGFHATNVVLHALVSALLLALGRGLALPRAAAWMAAALFAVHPVHVESVTWISGRTDVLAAAFCVATLLLYERGRRGRDLSYALSLGAAVLAMGSKETALLLPFLLAALEAARPVPGARLGEIARRLLPFGVLAGLFAVRILSFEHDIRGIDVPFPEEAGASARVYTAGRSLLAYFGRLVAPVELCAELEPDVALRVDPGVAGGLAAAVVLLVAGLVLRRSRPAVFFGAVLFAVGILPALSLVVDVAETAAERYLYLPSAGFVLAVAGAWPSSPRARRAGIAIGCAVVLAFTVRTIVRNRVWSDPVTLFADTARCAPDEPRARYLHAYALHGEGRRWRDRRNFPLANQRFEEAASEYRAAVERDPGFVDALHGLGVVLLELGRSEQGIERLEEAVGRDPGAPGIGLALGTALLSAGRFDEAYPLLVTAPDAEEETLLRAAQRFRHERRTAEAARLVERAIELHPGSADAYQLHGVMQAEAGRFAEADASLRASLGIDPNDAGALTALAMVLMQAPGLTAGRVQEAVALAERAVAIDPSPRFVLVLADVYARSGSLEQAKAVLVDALQRRPSDETPFRARLERIETIERARSPRDG